MAEEMALVGRERELIRVAEALAEGDAGILLAGPAGVGKTRLTVECLALAEDRGHATARVRANRAAKTIPYGAFAPLLPRAVEPEESAAATLARAADAVRALATDQPLFLVVDDAHDLDDASTALLHHLVVGGGVFALVTVRTGEIVPDAVIALWKDGLLARIDLPPLAVGDAARLIAEQLGPVDGVTAQTLFTTSGGNPLFLRELVIGAIESGALRETSGMWHLVGDLAPSTRLTEVVEARLGALDEGSRKVLELVSVGEPLPVTDLEGIASAAAIDDLDRRGLLQSQTDSGRTEVRMGHPLYGDVMRAALPGRRYAEVCRALANAAEDSGEGDSVRAAVWRLDGGGPASPASLLTAARAAYGAGDSMLARRLVEPAWYEGREFEAAHLLSRTLEEVGRYEEADAVLRAASASVVTDRQRAALARTHSGVLFRGLGRVAEAHQVLAAAQAEIAEPQWNQSATAERVNLLLYEGRLNEALASAEPLLRADDLAYAQAALPAAVALALAGRTADAVTVAGRGAEARRAIDEADEMAGPEIYLVAQALALTEAGRLREAEDLARLGYEGATKLGAPQVQAWLASILARIHVFEGRAGSAAHWGREAGVLWRELRHPAARWGFGARAFAAAMAGDIEEAAAAYAEVDAQPPTPVRVFDPEIDRGRAVAAAHKGDRTQAISILEDAARRAEAGGAWSLAAAAVHDLCRLGEVRTAGPRLTAMAEHVDGDMMKARLAHVAALTTDDADALDNVADAFDDVGAFLLAAEAALTAAGLHQSAGLRRKAAASRRRAETLLAMCDGSKPLGVVVTEAPTTLTPREREVATLAAGGLANREIADRLVVSQRTVENHIQRAFEKLGVRNREDLAAALDLAD